MTTKHLEPALKLLRYNKPLDSVEICYLEQTHRDDWKKKSNKKLSGLDQGNISTSHKF